MRVSQEGSREADIGLSSSIRAVATSAYPAARAHSPRITQEMALMQS